MTIPSLKHSLLIVYAFFVSFVSVGCEEILNINISGLVVYVGLTNTPLEKTDEIEVIAGTSNGFAVFFYQERDETVDPQSVEWKVSLRKDPEQQLDENITTEVKAQHFEVDASDLVISEPMYLLLTAKKGINRTISKTIKLVPKK